MKPFIIWINENTSLLTPDQFPHFLEVIRDAAPRTKDGSDIAHKNERGLAKFKDYIDLINDYLAQGGIPNPRFQEIKSYISTRWEYVWRLVAERFHHGGKYQTLPKEFQDRMYDPEPRWNNFDKVIDKIEKLPDHEAKTLMLQLAREFKPLADALVTLKTKSVKRQPKDPNDPTLQKHYIPPSARSEHVEVVRQKLTDITQQIHQEYKAKIVNYFKSVLERFQTYLKTEMADKNSPIRKFAGKDEMVMSLLYSVYTKRGVINTTLELKPNWQEIIEKDAENSSLFVQQEFVAKNAKKLASILSDKKNMIDCRITHARASASGIEGWMIIKFADGSQFEVQNKAVYSMSIYGNPFLRFPTTFHDVKLSDGSSMGRPSEERMNTVFIGKK